MTTFKVINIATDKNNGIRIEKNVRYTLLGYTGDHDCTSFENDSDITELSISVKSARFSLTSGGALHGTTKFEMIEDFFARVHSTTFCYVTRENIAYSMNKFEFGEFLRRFSSIEKDSTRNGGREKIRCKNETKEMLEWLSSQC